MDLLYLDFKRFLCPLLKQMTKKLSRFDRKTVLCVSIMSWLIVLFKYVCVCMRERERVCVFTKSTKNFVKAYFLNTIPLL